MFDPDDAGTADEVEAICVALDGIPLAIELAAGRIRSASLTEIRQQVAADPTRLARLGRDSTDHHHTVQSSIEWSVRLLTDSERGAHTRLSVLPGVFTTEAATAVTTGPVTDTQPTDPIREAAVPDLLARLVHRSLLAVVPSTRPGGPTRFRQLATVRAHATRALDGTGHTEDLLVRRAGWVRALLTARPATYAADTDHWYQRVEDNHDTLTAVLQHTLVDRPDPFGVQVTAQLTWYWFRRGRILEGERWMRAALTQSGADPADRALTQISLANSLALRDRADLAEPLLRDALNARQTMDKTRLAGGLLSASWCAWMCQDPSLRFADDEVRALTSDNEPTITLFADLISAREAIASAGPATVAVAAETLRQRAMQQGLVGAAWLASLLGAMCSLLTGDPHAGLTWIRRVQDYHRRLGGTTVPDELEYEGNFAVLAGDAQRGVRLFAQARGGAYRAGRTWPLIPATETTVARARGMLTTQQYDEAWRVGEHHPDPH